MKWARITLTLRERREKHTRKQGLVAISVRVRDYQLESQQIGREKNFSFLYDTGGYKGGRRGERKRKGEEEWEGKNTKFMGAGIGGSHGGTLDEVGTSAVRGRASLMCNDTCWTSRGRWGVLHSLGEGSREGGGEKVTSWLLLIRELSYTGLFEKRMKTW